MFKRLLRQDPLAATSIRQHLRHDSYLPGLRDLGVPYGRVAMLGTCTELIEAFDKGRWKWGKFAIDSIRALRKHLIERTWELALEPKPPARPKRKVHENFNNTPTFPKNKSFKAAPEDFYCDYGSFIPRRIANISK